MTEARNRLTLNVGVIDTDQVIAALRLMLKENERAAARRRCSLFRTVLAWATLGLVLALLGIALRPAAAQPYMTATYGGSGIQGVQCPAGAACRRYSTGGQVSIGWQLGSAWAVEMLAADLGKATARGTIAGRPAEGSIRGKGLGLFVVPRAAWDGGAVYARVGMAYTRTTARGSVAGLGWSSSEQDILRPAWSVGADIDLTPHVALRIDHLEARGRWLSEGTGTLTSAGLRVFW